MNFKKGKIYMLEPTCEYEEGDIYYGSTTQPLNKRYHQHKSQYFQGSKTKTKSFFLFEKYGLENIKIQLIKEIIFKTKEELNKEEGDYIRNNKCINKQIADRTRQEWIETNKDKISKDRKEYKLKNYECLIEKLKVFRIKNKDKKKEQDKIYYKKNREKILLQHEQNKDHLNLIKKKYYEKNKSKIQEKRKETFLCVCGCVCVTAGKARHLKTNKHLSFINSF